MPQDKSGTIRHLPDSVVCKKKIYKFKEPHYSKLCTGLYNYWRVEEFTSQQLPKGGSNCAGKKESRQRGGGGELQTDRCHR